MFTLVGPNGQRLEVVGLDGLEEMLGLPHDNSLSLGERALAVLSAAQQRGYDLGGIGQSLRCYVGIDERGDDSAIGSSDDGPSSVAFRIKRRYS